MEYISIIGLIAGTLTTASFLPQTIKIFRTKDTKGISLAMYISFNTGIALWLIYGIFKKDIPIIITNGVSLVLSMSILILKIIHK